jgi:hypothetical protein
LPIKLLIIIKKKKKWTCKAHYWKLLSFWLVTTNGEALITISEIFRPLGTAMLSIQTTQFYQGNYNTEGPYGRSKTLGHSLARAHIYRTIHRRNSHLMKQITPVILPVNIEPYSN